MTIPLETIQEKRFKEVNNSLREFFASLLSTLLSKHSLDYLTWILLSMQSIFVSKSNWLLPIHLLVVTMAICHSLREM